MISALVIIGLWPGLPLPEDLGANQRLRHWIDSTRELAGRLPRRYEFLEEAYRRMQQANAHLTPEQARHLTVIGFTMIGRLRWCRTFGGFCSSRRAVRDHRV